MRTLTLLLLTILLLSVCSGQDKRMGFNYKNSQTVDDNQPVFRKNYMRWESRYDTTVANKGDESCEHDWIQKEKQSSMTSCCVLHDERGCPDNWDRDELICRKCLRKIIVQEERYFPQSEVDRARRERQTQNEYEELNKRIDSARKQESLQRFDEVLNELAPIIHKKGKP